MFTYSFPLWRDLQPHESTLVEGVQSPGKHTCANKKIVTFKSGLTEFSDFPEEQSVHLEEGWKAEKKD